MQKVQKVLAVAVMMAFLGGGMAFGDDHHDDHHDNHHYVHHREWKRGYHMRHEDWDRGEHVDWRVHHLRRPPEGYEWREVDGNYVMAAVATGVIASVVVAASIH